jgi:hypothetical protein
MEENGHSGILDCIFLIKLILKMVKIHNLVISTLILVTFSRLLEVLLGFPAIINLIHFPIVAGIFFLTLDKTRNKKNPLIFGIIILFFVILLSGVINNAGLINIFLEFLLFAEPFLLLIILVNIDYSKESIHKLGKWLLFFGLVQIPFALYQYIVKPASSIGHTGPDAIKGTLLGMGAGHHVMGAIAIICAIYLLYSSHIKPFWLKYALAILLLVLPIISDAKQTIFAFLISYGLLGITKIKNPKRVLKYALIMCLFIALIFIVGKRLYPTAYFWEKDIMVRGLTQKFIVFPIINSQHYSPSGWLLGAGPGHTVGRLGFMLPKYWEVLEPFGATKSPITAMAWQQADWTAGVSSVFLPLFSWAGVLGDIGIIGFLVYIYLFWFVYRKFCKDDVSKILLISIFVFGWVFEWMEEPNFMLYTIAIIGQRWLAYGIKEKKPAYKETKLEKFVNKCLRCILRVNN